MREIRYRGIGIAERKWVFGSLWFDTRDGVTLIWSEELKYWVRVDPATVGQYTGLKDMHSAEIYEGDIIGGSNGSINGRYWPFQIIIEWDEAACGFNTPNWGYMDSTHFFEIKGNIHDNPELIEKQTAERHKNKNSMFKFPSPQNEKQIAGLRMFLEGCEERVRDRMNRGVMGDLKQ